MKKTREFWQGHVDTVKREGTSTSAYAKRHGVSLKSLYRWQRTLKCVPALPTTANLPVAFVSLRVAESAVDAPSSGCSLMLGTGLRLEMSSLPSPDWLATLMHAAQGAR
ncbi:MAG: hypothetical protein H7315_00060 [Herminiimonas sp.]|nr:hypothetical protein [Herminiimonas sp.]